MSLEKNTLKNINKDWAITYQGLTHRTLSFHIPVDMLAAYKNKVDNDVDLSHPDFNTKEFKSALTQAVNYHLSEDEDVDNVTDSLRKLNTHHREMDDRREQQLRQQIASLEEQQEAAESEGETAGGVEEVDETDKSPYWEDHSVEDEYEEEEEGELVEFEEDPEEDKDYTSVIPTLDDEDDDEVESGEDENKEE